MLESGATVKESITKKRNGLGCTTTTTIDNTLVMIRSVEKKKKKLKANRKVVAMPLTLLFLVIFLFYSLCAVFTSTSTPLPRQFESYIIGSSSAEKSSIEEHSDVEIDARKGKVLREAEDAQVRQAVHDALHDSGPAAIGQHESLLTFFLSSILREEDGILLPDGSILDCGAQFGEQAAHYAVTSPKRKVLAMDPSPTLVRQMQTNYGSLANFEVMQGGLGREVGTMKPRDDSFNMDKNEAFPLHTIDSIYYDKGETLAFAHLDVEGLEFDVLNGGLKTIRSNKPMFTVELRVHETDKTKQLLDLIDSEGYDAYVIDEVCGWPHIDLRNVLCIPRNRSKAFGKSDGFILLLMANALKRVTSDDIAQQILPCCALGGECCLGNDLNGEHCCTEKVVLDWYDKHQEVNRPPPSMLGWKTARKEFLTQQYRLGKRQRTK